MLEQNNSDKHAMVDFLLSAGAFWNNWLLVIKID